MSLINDALKKAQKQRTGESPSLASLPSVGGESAVRIAKRSKPVGFNALLIRLGLGAAALLLLVVGGYFAVQAMRSRPASPPPAKVAAKEEASPKPADAAAATTSAPSPAPTFVLPITVPPAATRPVVAKVEHKEVKAEPPPAPVVVAPPAPVKPPPPPKLEPRAITYIEGLRIAGIRASATDSKVLMNDRVYRVGDTIEHEMGIKLIGITSSSLTFEDERGARYMRQF